MGDVGHEVDRVIPHDSDPWRLRQNLLNWALGDCGSACRRHTLPVGVRHKTHSCNDPEGSRIPLLTQPYPAG